MPPASYTPPPPAEKASIWEDFIDIFYQPAEVFRRRADGRFGLALLLLTVLFAVIFYFTQDSLAPIMDQEIAKATERMRAANPNMTEEQAAGAMAMGRKFAIVNITLYMPIVILLLGTLLWLVGKFFDSAASWKQATTIAAYAQFPRIVEGIVNGVQGAMLDASSLTSRYAIQLGPARFLDDQNTNPVVLALLGRLDVFTIWITVLIGIGLVVIGGVSKARAAIMAALIWLLGSTFYIYTALKQR